MPQSSQFDVVCLGYSTIDYLGIVPCPLQSDTKVEMLEFAIQGGGPAATAAVTVSRLGGRTAFLGSIGDDAFGCFARRELADEGVDVSGIVTAPGARSQFSFIAAERDTGKRTIIWTRSGVPLMDPAELNRDIISSCKVLHVDRHEIPASIQAARWVRESGGLVSMDTGADVSNTADLLPLVDVLITSYAFAHEITGKSDPAECAEQLLDDRLIAGVTCGEDGSFFATRTERFHVPAFEVDVVDTTGAGDVFHGGFAYGLAQGWDARRCGVFASAAAAIKCTKLGGRAGIPRRAQVEELLKHRSA